MYVIIGSHFVPLEGKFLLIALVIVRITLNVMCDIKNGVSIVQKTCCQTLEHFDTVIFTCCENRKQAAQNGFQL
jgi:hypothetical protein